MSAIDRWFTAPADNAAGNLGLFRILFSGFFLWHLSWVSGPDLAASAQLFWSPVSIFRVVPGPPPVWAVSLGESLLAGALVLLMVGRHVRSMTWLVLGLGAGLEAFTGSVVKVEHGTVFLTFYIPLVMLCADWGATYSVDAALVRRAGGATVRAEDPSWRFAWPGRALLVLLAVLFGTAFALKIAGGPWLTTPDYLATLCRWRNIDSMTIGLAPSPLAAALATTPMLSEPLQYGVLALEGAFPLAVLGGRVRDTLLSAALVFHAANALVLSVTFTPIAIVYALFVDWQALAARVRGRVRVPALSSTCLRAIALGGGVAVAATWETTTVPRSVVNVAGLLDWRTFWFLVGPAGLAWGLVSVARLIGPGRPSPHRVPP